MSFSERRQRFRAILAGDQCVHPASVFDPISARIAEDVGFEIGMFAGSIASFAVLGAPDLVVLTLTEFAEQIRRITRAGMLPLLVDADHGYGNALNVMRTVEELEAAGVAALTIEDTKLPRGYGEAGTQLISIEEGEGKIRAALAARRDPALVVVARTSAASATGLDDAIRRARVYAQTGADALFLTGVSAPDQVRAIRAAAALPILLGGTGGSLGDRAAMAALGVRVALQGHAPFLAGVQAVHDTMKALREGTPPTELKGVASAELMRTLTRDAAYTSAIRQFLGGG
jgi:carboxyvinyl-carboxyphosphonate phosphorylmutase